MKTVAIVGSHTRTRDDVPWDNKDIDIWVFNEAASIGWPKRVDAVFQMHAEPVWKNPLNRNNPEFPAWLREQHKYPLWMLDEYPEIPASKSYPLDEICDLYLPLLKKGLIKQQFFTSTVAYTVALAMFQGYECIQLYGVEMASDTEYHYQRDGVFFWLGMALSHGIEIYIPEKSRLFSEPLYGYEGGAYLGREQIIGRKELLQLEQEKVEAELERANQMQKASLDTAMDESGGEPGMAAVATTKQYLLSVKAQVDAIVKAGMFRGALEEVDRYLLKCDQMDKMSGAHLLARQEFELTAANADQLHLERKAQLDVLGAEARAAWKGLGKAVKDEQNQKILNKLSMAYGKAHQAYLESAFEVGRLHGIVQENFTLLNMVDELVKAAGGMKAEEAILESERKKTKRRRHRKPKLQIEEVAGD